MPTFSIHTTHRAFFTLIATLCLGVVTYAQPSAFSRFTFNPASPTIAPGEKKEISATLVEPDGSVTAGVVTSNFGWKLANTDHADYIQIIPSGDKVTVVGLNPPAGAAKPSAIPIVVTYIDTGGLPVNLSTAINVSLATPTVKATWDVLPTNVCKHSFGRAVGDDYYCIEVTITNRSGFDLQIADVTFTLAGTPAIPPVPAAAGVPAVPAIPAVPGPTVSSTGYNIVRNTLRHRNMFYPRAIVLNTITALGPLLTGFTPYFHNQAHRGNFTEGINILSNPLEKGLEKAWPDPTGRHLENFEGISLREGVIIPNNGPPLKTRVFYPKRSLKLLTGGKKDNPDDVRKALGTLNLEGNAVSYVNAIRITSP